MEGYGVKTYIDRNLYKYIGEWKNGRRHGQGTQIYTGGERYEGGWRNGQSYGEGTFTSPNGNKTKGILKRGIYHGPVTEYFTDGRIWIVERKNNKRHGRGIVVFPDGTKITGEWINHKLVGSSDFYGVEFEEQKYNMGELYSAIKADISFSSTSEKYPVRRLNELLEIPDLYEQLYEKINAVKTSKEIDFLIEKTRDFRNMNFSQLSYDKQEDIKRLNRLLIEHVYPEKTPKLKW
jgi:hypothetical protein